MTTVIIVFSVIGAIDWLIGNKFGIGREFERAYELFCPMALSMIGMLVIAPAVGEWLSSFFDFFYNTFGIDPSVIPASLLANDMGGMTLAEAICKSEEIGKYNAYVVSSMLGCMISFTLPFSLGIVNKSQHNELFLGFLCGIITIPFGCFVAGLVCKIPIFTLLLNLLPLIIIGALLGIALVFFRAACIKCFAVLGIIVRAVALFGLVCSIFTFLTKIEISPNFDSFENAAFVCANACVTLSGALPLMFIVDKLLHKPLNAFGSKIGINGISALAFLGSLVTNSSTFGVMDRMDKRGTVLNSAFAVSASFVFGSHLAFTMAFDTDCVLPMIIGKIISGIFAVGLALLVYKDTKAA